MNSEEVQEWAERVGREVTSECPIIDEEGKTRMPESAYVCVCNPWLNLTYYFKNLLRFSTLFTALLIHPHRETTLYCYTADGFSSGPCSTQSHTHTHIHTQIYMCTLSLEGRGLFLFITRCEDTQVQVKITLIRQHVSERLFLSVCREAN